MMLLQVDLHKALLQIKTPESEKLLRFLIQCFTARMQLITPLTYRN